MERDTGIESGASLRNLLAALPDIVYVLDPSGHFVYLNDMARALEYEPASLVGKHFSEILHPDDRKEVSREIVLEKIRAQDKFPDVPPKLFDERRSGARMTRELEVRIVKGDGTLFYASVNAYGATVADPVLAELFGCEGAVTVGIIHDVTDSRLYRQTLEENLAAKELMLREIHHRVKNNLQMVTSLAHLREKEAADELVRQTLAELIGQIKSIAMVHEVLYDSERLGGVDAAEYFSRLGRLLQGTFGRVGSSVRLSVEAESAVVDAATLSQLAMIASELSSAAFKREFLSGGQGRIILGFRVLPECDVLSVRLESDPSAGRIRGGLEVSALLTSLAAQIGAEIVEVKGASVGAEVRMPRNR